MNKKIKIIITTTIIFLFSSASLFTYYSVYEPKEIEGKYVIKTIKWADYILNKPQDRIKLFDPYKKDYDEYHLDDINFNEIFTTSKDIVKEVEKYSNIVLEKKDFPEILEFDQNTDLKLSNIVVEPTIAMEKQWHEEIESVVKTYNYMEDADLINIPKEIYENNDTWFLLTDTSIFNSMENMYNCTASYSRVRSVEEEKPVINGYRIKAIYSGKLLTKTGNVILKYKLTGQNTEKEIYQQFSFKIFILSIFIFIIIISFLVIYKRLFKNNLRNI